MNAETAGHVGTAQLKQFHMVYIDMWHHPKYYKELRKLRNKLDQVISKQQATASGERSPGPGPKQQAASAKLQAPSDSNNKPQASSDKQQASSSKPQASSSDLITTKSFTAHEPRCWTKIKLFLGCFVEANLMGDRRTLLPS